MNLKKLELIQRIIYLEEKISNIRLMYPELEKLDIADKLMFFSKKIEESEVLTIEEWEYFNLACIIPFEKIQIELNKYDNSSPKMDEIKFIDDLSKNYNVNRNVIKTRIKQVRKINKVIEKESNQKFTVLAVPCNRAFVVAPEKSEAFKNSTNSKEDNEEISRMVEEFERNLVVDIPKVKTLGKKQERK